MGITNDVASGRFEVPSTEESVSCGTGLRPIPCCFCTSKCLLKPEGTALRPSYPGQHWNLRESED
jgi:hypothetical protein